MFLDRLRTFSSRLILAIILLTVIQIFTLSCSQQKLPEEDLESNSESDQSHQIVELDQQNSADPEIEDIIDQNTVVKPRIALYTGTGSWDLNITAFENFYEYHDLEWITINEQDFSQLPLNDLADVIWFPGGFAAEYKHYIKNHEIIINYVERGGTFIGSCAGAYYGSKILRWQGTDYEYPLQLFNGKGVGPLSGLINWGDSATFNLNQEHPANANFDVSLEFYYFDGPYFEPE